MTRDTPSYLMIVENGRLLPAHPLDQERLLTFTNGTEIECVFKSTKNGVLIRKLYVVTGHAVKQCPTPWQTADEAVQAMKDALGLVDYGAGYHGQQLRYLRSLNDLEEPELLEFMEGCWAILAKITGVDPLTLRKEAGDTTSPDSDPALTRSPPEQESGTDEEGSGGGFEALEIAAADRASTENSEIDAQAGEGHAGAATEVETHDAPPPTVSASTPSPDDPVALRAEMVSKLFHLANEPLSVQDRLEALESARPAWEERLPGEMALVRQTFETVRKAIEGRLPQDAARRFAESL